MTRQSIVPKSMQGMYDQWHFSPAMKAGGLAHLSGQIGIGPDGTCPEDPKEQFTLAFENVKTILSEAGLSFDDIVEITTFHVGLQSHIQTFMEVAGGYITEPYPAWTAIGITELAVPGGLVEIKVTALTG